MTWPSRSTTWHFALILRPERVSWTDWDALPGTVPASIRLLVRRCLKKDRKQRLQAIGDARIAIDEVLSGSLQEAELASASASQERYPVSWAVAVVLAVIAAIAGVGWWRATRSVNHPLMRLSVGLGPEAIADQFSTATISPDGARLVFPVKSSDGKQMLATRLLSEAKPSLLSGTENGGDPFFSPDSKWIGFFADGKMKKISVQGGAPVVLCDASLARGANWGQDGNIIVALNTSSGLSRVSSEGGMPQPFTKLEGGALSHRWPQLLPGGDA